MNYVLKVISCLNQRGLDEVVLMARGRSISTTVDGAEVTKRMWEEDMDVGVNIRTEQMPAEAERTRNVSTIEITLTMRKVTMGEPIREVKGLKNASEEEKTGKKGVEPEEIERFGFI